MPDRVLTYFAKYLNILCHLSLDTLPFMSTYFFEAVLRQNQGIYYYYMEWRMSGMCLS